MSTLAAGHLTLVPQLKAALHELGRDDVLIVVGGVIPPQDFDALREAGAAAIFPPGTVIADAAVELLDAPRRPLTVAVLGLDVDAYEAGVLAADRTALGRAITLVESTRPDHQEQAQELLARLLPTAGGAHRIGITGVPGAGKSTFIDALGSDLTASGNRVAVLAVDPSSTRTGGSILGDKTRMGRLAVDDHAFIRPSPNAGVLGGVARATRESIVVVEAAGFDVVFVETVGVGQSEVTVANMVDTFLLLTLARTGDSLQGIKKGVLELADVIAVNKADGDHVVAAKGAARELAAALHLVAPSEDGWSDVGADVQRRRAPRPRHACGTSCAPTAGTSSAPASSAEQRRRQDVSWMWATIDDRLLARFRAADRARAAELEEQVRRGEITPTAAAERSSPTPDPAVLSFRCRPESGRMCEELTESAGHSTRRRPAGLSDGSANGQLDDELGAVGREQVLAHQHRPAGGVGRDPLAAQQRRADRDAQQRGVGRLGGVGADRLRRPAQGDPEQLVERVPLDVLA